MSAGYQTGELQTSQSRSQTSCTGLSSLLEVDSNESHSANSSRQGALAPFSSLQGVLGRTSSFSSGSGQPSSVREEKRHVLYSRSASSKPRDQSGSSTRDVLKCLRCGKNFLISNLDEYEKHIRRCYSL